MGNLESVGNWNNRVERAKQYAFNHVRENVNATPIITGDVRRMFRDFADGLKLPEIPSDPTPEQKCSVCEGGGYVEIRPRIQQRHICAKCMTPTPEPPEFKPNQWVMHRHFGLGRLIRLEYIKHWEIAFSDTKRFIDKDDVGRHATDAEKFQPGAVAEWRSQWKNGKATIEDEIAFVVEDTGGKIIRLHFVKFHPNLSFGIDYCTLITAAPEASDD